MHRAPLSPLLLIPSALWLLAAPAGSATTSVDARQLLCRSGKGANAPEEEIAMPFMDWLEKHSLTKYAEQFAADDFDRQDIFAELEDASQLDEYLPTVVNACSSKAARAELGSCFVSRLDSDLRGAFHPSRTPVLFIHRFEGSAYFLDTSMVMPQHNCLT